MGQTNANHGRKGAGKVKRLGRTKTQIAHYYARVYAPRKIRHMLKSNGYRFALAWAQKNNCSHLVPDKERL